MYARDMKKAFWVLLFVVYVVLFASPVKAEQETLVYTADEILELINNNEDVLIKGAFIDGSINFTKVKSEVPQNDTTLIHVHSKIDIVDSTINGNIIANTPLTRVVFNNEINFHNVTILGYSDFRLSHFSNDVSFIETQFSQVVIFEKAQFFGDANFVRSNFTGNAWFWETQFSGYVDFSNAQFSGSAYFYEIQFSRGVSFQETQFFETYFWDSQFPLVTFWKARFSGKTEFQDVRFSDIVFFCEAEFLSKTYFSRVHFSHIASFLDSQFWNETIFIDVVFNDIALFTNANFMGYTYFNLAIFRSIADFRDTLFYYALFSDTPIGFPCATIFYDLADFRGASFNVANFTGVRFSKVDFSGTHFSRKLVLKDSLYSSMKIDWRKVVHLIQPDDDPEIFRKLEENFRALKRLDFANGAFYRYKIVERQSKSQPVKYLETVFLDWTCGYGVRPQNVIVISTFLILAFSLVYLPSGAMIHNQVTKKKRLLTLRLRELPLASSQQEQERQEILETRSRIERFWKAIGFSFTVFTKIGFGDSYGTSRVRRFIILEWFLGLAMISLLFYTLSNTVPLIRALLTGIL